MGRRLQQAERPLLAPLAEEVPMVGRRLQQVEAVKSALLAPLAEEVPRVGRGLQQVGGWCGWALPDGMYHDSGIHMHVAG